MKKRIVCFGDSNTWGLDSIKKERFSEHVRWTRLIGKKLNETMNVEIIEEGLNARTSVLNDPLREGLNVLDYIFPSILTNSPIDLLIIMLGTNDSKERFAMTSYDIASGIIRLANKAKETLKGLEERDNIETKILIIAPARIRPEYKNVDSLNSFGEKSDEKTKELPKILEELAKINDFYFLNADKEVRVGENDYVHLDEKGHKDMAEIVTKKVREIFNS